jgi:hypothetical protein
MVSGTNNPYGLLYFGNKRLENWCTLSKAVMRSWIDFNGDGIYDLACNYKDGTHAILVGTMSMSTNSSSETPDFTKFSTTISPITIVNTMPTVTSSSSTGGDTGTTTASTNGTTSTSNTNATPTTTDTSKTTPVNTNPQKTENGTTSTSGAPVKDTTVNTYVDNSTTNIITYNNSTITNNNGTPQQPESKMGIIIGVAASGVAIIAGIVSIILKCKKKCCFAHKKTAVPDSAPASTKDVKIV